VLQGGHWHVEGQLNEHIISTAIYYYDDDNISDSNLKFRTSVNNEGLTTEEFRHEDADYRSLKEVFELRCKDSYIIHVGAVKTREDRFIAFPNGFQHRVSSFELQDPTKPGHRKILAMCLVAPQDPILSTANIPPQRFDWWLRELVAPGTRLGNLPTELMDMIEEKVEGFPIRLEEAHKIRLDLMDERSEMDGMVDEWIHEAAEEFDLCEHW